MTDYTDYDEDLDEAAFSRRRQASQLDHINTYYRLPERLGVTAALGVRGRHEDREGTITDTADQYLRVLLDSDTDTTASIAYQRPTAPGWRPPRSPLRPHHRQGRAVSRPRSERDLLEASWTLSAAPLRPLPRTHHPRRRARGHLVWACTRAEPGQPGRAHLPPDPQPLPDRRRPPAPPLTAHGPYDEERLASFPLGVRRVRAKSLADGLPAPPANPLGDHRVSLRMWHGASGRSEGDCSPQTAGTTCEMRLRAHINLGGSVDWQDRRDIERAVERGVRRANGETDPEEGCMAVAGCLVVLIVVIFIAWVIIASN